jgi:hypothetical protein
VPIAAQRQFLVKVSGVDGYFAQKSGGNAGADVTRVFNGGSLVPEVLAAPAQVEDVTVSRPYDPGRDAGVIARLAPLVSRWRTTISVTPTDADLVPVAAPSVFANALLTNVAHPEADAGSGDAGTFALTFAVPTVA